ncbi:CGNR zinc finger domain-containing protein [Flexithrix dorotheae]|uniref:CGNR zinc finger domain-containing protein n=1 Tax=Flexithrix dorotheae TaxID=70993 RepID=UPI00035E2715|nr:CGNR zinc finger domain-containing protein [Flexithrix dorotheae]
MKINILNFNEEEMVGVFQKKYANKSFFSRYIKFYYLLTIPEILALVVSTVLSYKWWASFEIINNLEYGFILACLGTCSVSVAIFLLTNHTASLWMSEKKMDEFLYPLILLICLNIYTDWNGISPLAETVYEKPVFAQQKEDSLQGSIRNILLSYRWCATHNAKHQVNNICEHTFVPGSAGQLLDSYKKYGYEPETDKATIALLQQQITRLNQDYSEQKAAIEGKRNQMIKTGRGGTIICLIVFLFCGIWKHSFAGKVAVSNNPGPKNPTSPTEYPSFSTLSNYPPKLNGSSFPKNDSNIFDNKDTTVVEADTTVISDEKGFLEERICQADDCEAPFYVDLRKEVPGRNKRKYCSGECAARMRKKMNKVNKLKKKKWVIHTNDHDFSNTVEWVNSN